MSDNKRYWMDLGELHQQPEAIKGRENEFPQELAIDQVLGDPSFGKASTGRRDFLKFLGFGIGAATLAACETPVIKSIPYVNKPEDITPGVANWYASTFYDGEDFASILVKTREGRPIHIKGNPRFGINRNPALTKGSINARINSSVLSLYDNERVTGPMTKGAEGMVASTWADADKAIGATLRSTGKRIVVLTGTVISPSTLAAINALKAKYIAPAGDVSGASGTKVDHIQYDPISYSGVTSANQKSFGKRVFPSYDLTKADVIVSVDADFLSSWGSTTENTWQYSSRRQPGAGMNRHFQFEARMSMTGANADVRVPLKVSELPQAVVALHAHIAKGTGSSASSASVEVMAATEGAAKALLAARGHSLVISGSNNEGVQVLVNSINNMLGNYGSTIDLFGHTNFHQGNDADVARLVENMNSGAVGALLIAGVNPAYTLPNADQFKAGLSKVPLSVSFSGYADETASLCTWICPDNHALESWNDLNPKVGHYALAQPTIRPLFKTRQWQESLLAWSGSTSNYHDFIRSTWEANMAGLGYATPFADSWNTALHDGVITMGGAPAEVITFTGDLSSAVSTAQKSAEGAGEFELSLYTKESIGSGVHANNPWLQEMPDPLTKITWDNYVCMSPADIERMGLNMYLGEQSPASLVTVKAGDREITLPAVVTPGQRTGTVSIALGYGRGANGQRVGRAACTTDHEGNFVPVGKNAYPLTTYLNGAVGYDVVNVSVEKAGGTYPIAITQTHLTDMDRDSIVKETSLATFIAGDKRAYNKPHELVVHEDVNGDGVINALDKKPVAEFDLWEEFPVEGVGHHWGLSIDLNGCIGCGACITACNSENNISVVGKDEVRRSREMHWLRVDRYYSSATTKETAKQDGLGKIDMYLKMEVPEESPKVVFMPVMCQHCNHAPCETVCPVAATTHSNEGLNMMTYNRCIGTRYCANNCPYKVRRFNWFNYVSEKFGEVNPAWDDLGRMVLNPDVTVRSRGVIEKCSMCIQQIQAGKLEAKKAGTPVKDGSIETACSAACGSGAITFGDLNDKKSKVLELATADRSYHMLEEIGVKPSVNYLVKVRNTEEAAAHHA